MPKTGGTTFSRVLERVARGEVLRDYDDIPLSNRPEHARQRQKAPDLTRLNAQQVPVVYGHFVLSKYLQLRGQVAFGAVFREPTARIVSHYFHYRRNQGGPRNEILPAGLTLLDFAGLPKYCDMYRFLLGEVEVSELAYVGMTEDLPRSAKLLSAILTGTMPSDEVVELDRLNCATEYEDPIAYLRSEGVYEDVLAAQSVNRAIYAEARERFAELCSRYGI